jgi:hypothetical protein
MDLKAVGAVMQSNPQNGASPAGQVSNYIDIYAKSFDLLDNCLKKQIIGFNEGCCSFTEASKCLHCSASECSGG